MKKVFWIGGFVLCFSFSAAHAQTSCPPGTTEGEDCWSCGSDCKAYLSDDTTNINGNKQLNIIGSGKMKYYGAIKQQDGQSASGTPWQPYMSEITNVNISNDMTTIADGLLWGASNVKNVTIPENVTSIGNWAFLGTALTSVAIPNNVKNIGAYAFSATKISEIVIPDSVETIGSFAFQNTQFLTEIEIPDNVQAVGQGIFLNAGIQKVYCNNKNGRCDKFFSENSNEKYNLKDGVLIGYLKDGNRYILDGVRYKNLDDLKNDVPVKLSYTPAEAAQVVGDTNTLVLHFE